MNELIIPPIFPENIKAFFTTKKTPKSNSILPGLPVYRPIQRHTSKVLILDTIDDVEMKRRVADGVITDKRGVVLSVETADCVPILLCDPQIPVIGAVHAGWRGTAGGILINAIKRLVEVFSSRPERILIAIGPSIGGCCYEVDEPVMKAITAITGSRPRRRNGRYLIDLKEENLKQALTVGIPRENIWLSSECTFCSPERFHSFRYEKEKAGRQGGYIFIEI